MNTSKNIYALLVGINDYLSPDISNLSGTHKDLEDVHNYILSSYEQLEKKIEILKDADANRANIVKHFEQHLGQAQEGDIVLFYYSGHGSWGKTNQAFFKFDPDEREEGLVCYDSRVEGQFDLADKEMAVLLNYVARNNAEVVLLIDSCHSGSITRFADSTTRLAGGSNQIRTLTDYLYDSTLEEHQNYYQQLSQENGGSIPELPMSRHLSMSACSERELARETKEGGWFTQSLLKVLQENPSLSYFQVYSQVFSAISQKHEKQTPQLEAYGLFNANNVFLTGEKSLTKSTRFRIGKSEKTRSFRIDFGAQTGFPLDISRAINFNIYETKDAEEPVGMGQVNSIGLVDSEIRLSFQKQTREVVYWGEVLDYALAPTMICFEGDPEDLELLQAELQKRTLQQIVFVNNDSVCPFILAWDNKDACYRLSEQQQEKVWNTTLEQYETTSFNRSVFILEMGKDDLKDEHKIDLIIEVLEHLNQWKYTIDLDNPKSRINKKGIEIKFDTQTPSDAYKVKCLVQEGNGTVEYELEEANQRPQKDYHKLVLNYTEEEEINYVISIKNNSREKYHLALALISEDHQVYPLQSNILLEPGEELEDAIGADAGSLYIPRKGDNNITSYLKVFISKQEITTLQGFTLPALKMEEQLQYLLSNSDRAFGARKDLKDWCTKTIAFNLKRDIQNIGGNEVEIDRRGIVIHQHSNLTANVRLNSPEQNTRSANQLFDTLPSKVSNFELFFMDDGTGFPSETVLELTNIENETTLTENPLKISVPKTDGELVFPFTVETILVPQEDGSYQEETIILPIGTNAGLDDNGNDLYEIYELPTHSNKGTKSLGKALKMCFGKLFLSQDNYNLCWVDYTQEGRRESEGIAEKVAEAKNILVVLHGIIGDTSAMAVNMEFATQYYDLVLTYDYENLNTPILETATHLKSSLTAAGIIVGAEKTVDFVAHSMGGLVSRAFIESPELQGNLLVRNLYMLGTPNAGSAFSKIATYRDLITAGMTFALNFKTFGVASLAKMVTGLSATKNLTITLEQMGVGSPFLQTLNTHATPDDVQYYVIAGDISNYKSEADGVLAKIVDWISVKVGHAMYGQEQNDIAVSTESILGVPTYFQPITERVDCHHMIYFVHEPSMTILEGWMRDNAVD
ncbi:MAG: caspase family protein [Aureispira sp.]